MINAYREFLLLKDVQVTSGQSVPTSGVMQNATPNQDALVHEGIIVSIGEGDTGGVDGSMVKVPHPFKVGSRVWFRREYGERIMLNGLEAVGTYHVVAYENDPS